MMEVHALTLPNNRPKGDCVFRMIKVISLAERRGGDDALEMHESFLRDPKNVFMCAYISLRHITSIHEAIRK